MDLLKFIFVAVIPLISNGLIVHGPPGPLVAPLGSSVVLPCYVDEFLLIEGLEVEWRRTDSEALVHLYQDGESRPEAQQQEYHDRAHFFTDQIQHGNFSIHLDNLRTEDAAEYTCKVYSQQDSGETVVQIKYVERLLVSGSDESVSAYDGEDIILNCSVDSHITPEHIERVSWKKTDEDKDLLVLLHQNNQTLPDSSDERYRDRGEFFTDEIPKGNFSLRLKSVRTDDKGVYMCQVFAGGLSANATVVLERLGFSVLHIMVLILCVTASGSALLLCIKIYCTSPNNGFFLQHTYYHFFHLGDSVVLPCHPDTRFLRNNPKVEWRKKDKNILVCLYHNGENRPEEQSEDYHNRAHFFIDEIEHGNFSLRLNNLRAKDKGFYTCKVYIEQDCVFSAETKLVKGFAVEHSCHTLAPLGSSVVLPSYVDLALPMEGLKVEWRRTDSETLVHLYQNAALVPAAMGESQAEAQHQDYRDRAHLFTDNQNENFSLCLDNLRAEDEGRYTCKIYNQGHSVYSSETKLTLRHLDTVFRLQMCLVLFPNVIMFFAFVCWGFSEGFFSESVFCCALYFLRPLMLLFAAPYVHNFTGNFQAWIVYYSYDAEYLVFSAVVYSVLFKSDWDKTLHNAASQSIRITSLFVIMFIFTLMYIIFLLTKCLTCNPRIVTCFSLLTKVSIDVLPLLQFTLLCHAFGSTMRGLIIVGVFPLILTLKRFNWDIICLKQMNCLPLFIRFMWLSFMLIFNTLMVCGYIKALENEKDQIGWVFMIVFLQVLWSLIDFTRSMEWDIHRVVPVYVFGSVGVVLLNSVALMTELILKAVHGDRSIGDLRVVVFSSEVIFTLFLLFFTVFEPWTKTRLRSCLVSYLI